MLYFFGRAYVYKHVGEMEKDEKRSQSVSHVKLLEVIFRTDIQIA